MQKIVTPEPWALAAYVLIRNARGRVLLLRRSQSSKHFPGCWELPGGKPAPGENFAKTAQLEVSEETGLDVVPSGVVGAVEGDVPGLRVAMLILEARAPEVEITLSEEHDAYQWVAPLQVGAFKLRPGFDIFFEQYASQHTRKKIRRATVEQQSHR